MHRSTRPDKLSSGTSALRTTMVEQPVSRRTLTGVPLPIPLLPASYLTCLGTGTRQQRLESVFQSWQKAIMDVA